MYRSNGSFLKLLSSSKPFTQEIRVKQVNLERNVGHEFWQQLTEYCTLEIPPTKSLLASSTWGFPAGPFRWNLQLVARLFLFLAPAHLSLSSFPLLNVMNQDLGPCLSLLKTAYQSIFSFKKKTEFPQELLLTYIFFVWPHALPNYQNLLNKLLLYQICSEVMEA